MSFVKWNWARTTFKCTLYCVYTVAKVWILLLLFSFSSAESFQFVSGRTNSCIVSISIWEIHTHEINLNNCRQQSILHGLHQLMLTRFTFLHQLLSHKAKKHQIISIYAQNHSVHQKKLWRFNCANILSFVRILLQRTFFFLSFNCRFFWIIFLNM